MNHKNSLQEQFALPLIIECIGKGKSKNEACCMEFSPCFEKRATILNQCWKSICQNNSFLF